MLIACWSAKGGSGTTVVACALAMLFAENSASPVRLADLAGDVPAALGLPDPAGPGLLDWARAGDDVPAGALGRLEVPAGRGLRVLPRGDGPAPPGDDDGERLARALTDDAAAVVDCGTVDGSPSLARGVASVASLSLLVTRPCYLSLRRAVALPFRPSGIVLVADKTRTLTRSEVEDVLDVPVRASIEVEPTIARAVDAGLLTIRMPGALSRPLSRALRARAR